MSRYSLDVYDEDFFRPVQEEGLKHAEWFMPLLMRVIPFKDFVDAGCGTGYFVKWCLDHKIHDCLGMEGSEWAVQHAICDNISPFDLRNPLPVTEQRASDLGVKFEVALCLEVAEHIEAEHAEIFAENLTKISDTIVMTAAPPGQTGTCHVNEQPQEYWEQIFLRLGYVRDLGSGTLLGAGCRLALVEGKHVAPWLLTNLMVFRKKV